MPRVRMLGGKVQIADVRSAKPPEKVADPIYGTPEFREWRETVVANAGRRCEAIEAKTGRRCIKAEPHHRMFADHKVEVKDGGALYALANGQCLCGAHHTIKTYAERAARLARHGG